VASMHPNNEPYSIRVLGSGRALFHRDIRTCFVSGLSTGGQQPTSQNRRRVSRACENHRPQRERFLLTLTESETFLTTCDLSTLCLHWTVNTGIHTAAKFVVTQRKANAILGTREGTGR
jgi:hypothetical protein